MKGDASHAEIGGNPPADIRVNLRNRILRRILLLLLKPRRGEALECAGLTAL